MRTGKSFLPLLMTLLPFLSGCSGTFELEVASDPSPSMSPTTVAPPVVNFPATASGGGDNCRSMMKRYGELVDGGRSLAFTLVSNQSALNGVVSYTEGLLSKTPDGDFKSFRPGGYARAYFGDRRQGEHPFNPQKTDDIELIIKSSGDLEMRLKDWGDAPSEIKHPTCSQDLIYGWGPNRGGGQGQALYVLSIVERLPRAPG
jgi:hypothetical protein